MIFCVFATIFYTRVLKNVYKMLKKVVGLLI